MNGYLGDGGIDVRAGYCAGDVDGNRHTQSPENGDPDGLEGIQEDSGGDGAVAGKNQDERTDAFSAQFSQHGRP
jgi:hypothetical protein